MNLTQFLARAGIDEARRHGTSYLARCPAHDDRHPSLSIAEGEDGRILVYCRAGCETQAVLAALGLRLVDLFPPRSLTRGRR